MPIGIVGGIAVGNAQALVSPFVQDLGFTQPQIITRDTDELSWEVEFSEEVVNFTNQNIPNNIEIINRETNQTISNH